MADRLPSNGKHIITVGMVSFCRSNRPDRESNSDCITSLRAQYSATYMVFGGGSIDHRNAISNVSLAGLSLRHAKPIQSKYPDFHRCASPGAALAKDKVVSFDIVPADGDTLELLQSTLDDFDDSINNNGDRICIALSGTRLKLVSAEVREVGEDVTATIQMTKFYFVDSASRVDCQEAMASI